MAERSEGVIQRAGVEKRLGRYELVVELGETALGTLSLGRVALGAERGRWVTIRRVERGAEHDDATLRGLREAVNEVVTVAHPRVVSALEARLGTSLLVTTEYVEGEPLRLLMAAARARGVPFTPEIVTGLMLDLARVVLEVQSALVAVGLGRPLVGIGPDCVLVGVDGRCYLADLGLASLQRPPRHAELMAYRAPEQLGPPGSADERSVVFSLGVLWWELLAGRSLFGGGDQAAVWQRVRGAAVEIPAATPTAVRGPLLKALEREPAARWGLAALVDVLAGLAAGAPDGAAGVEALLQTLAGEALAERRAAQGAAVALVPSAPPPPAVVGLREAPELAISLPPRPLSIAPSRPPEDVPDEGGWELVEEESLAPGRVAPVGDGRGGTQPRGSAPLPAARSSPAGGALPRRTARRQGEAAPVPRPRSPGPPPVGAKRGGATGEDRTEQEPAPGLELASGAGSMAESETASREPGAAAAGACAPLAPESQRETIELELPVLGSAVEVPLAGDAARGEGPHGEPRLPAPSSPDWSELALSSESLAGPVLRGSSSRPAPPASEVAVGLLKGLDHLAAPVREEAASLRPTAALAAGLGAVREEPVVPARRRSLWVPVLAGLASFLVVFAAVSWEIWRHRSGAESSTSGSAVIAPEAGTALAGPSPTAAGASRDEVVAVDEQSETASPQVAEVESARAALHDAAAAREQAAPPKTAAVVASSPAPAAARPVTAPVAPRGGDEGPPARDRAGARVGASSAPPPLAPASPGPPAAAPTVATDAERAPAPTPDGASPYD